MTSVGEVLVDTSIWIEYFRGRRPEVTELLDELLDRDFAVLCGVVELELLQGMVGKAGQSQSRKLQPLLRALPYVDASREDFVQAGESLARLRTEGFTVPATDGLIASICLRLGLSLLTLDAHFDHWPELRRVTIS